MSAGRPAPVYWRAGGRGPALVLLNGWSASGLAWPRSFVRRLQQDFRVIRVDNRGSGYSRDADAPFTMRELAEDVIAVMEDAEIDRATVFGLSMGGMIAQELAIIAPERVAGLVLAGTAPPMPGYKPSTSTELSFSLLRPLGFGESLRTYLTRLWSFAAAPGFAEAHPDVIAELVEQILARPTPRGLLLHQLRAVTGWGQTQRLARITAPTIVVHGAQDAMMEIAAGRALSDLIPRSRYVELEGVGHLVAHEAPEVAIELIVEASRASEEASRFRAAA